MIGSITETSNVQIDKRGLTMQNNRQDRVRRRKLQQWVFAAGVLGALTLPAHAEWYFEVGPMYRGNMEISVRGGSRAGRKGDTSGGGIPLLDVRFAVDDGNAQILRTFDDGYVGPSGWGWAHNDGVTQYFAYDNPGQYDATAHTLTYQMTLRESTSQTHKGAHTAAGSLAWGGSRKTDGWGLMGTLGYRLREEESWSLGAQVRLGWLDGLQAHFSGRQSMEYATYETTAWREEGRTYIYDTLGNPAFPAAPYEMSNPSGVGPLIADTPTTITQTSQTSGTSTRQVGRSSPASVSSLDLRVEAQAFTLQLGPRIMWNPGKRIALLLQPALTANLLDVDIHRAETLHQPNGAVIDSWHDTSNKQVWRMGAGVQAGIQLALSEQWNVTAAGGYEWVDKYRLSVGSDHVTVDLSGYQLELALGRTF